jgi:hypothetical protein
MEGSVSTKSTIPCSTNEKIPSESIGTITKFLPGILSVRYFAVGDHFSIHRTIPLLARTPILTWLSSAQETRTGIGRDNKMKITRAMLTQLISFFVMRHVFILIL